VVQEQQLHPDVLEGCSTWWVLCWWRAL
jgi:hypothetical protein